ncbi:fungal zn(2)-Cys(6) binuclear cluster domain-containing protein [Hirsutella rhossiliensis]|uniref:Fungal zn(2)-Cys(6) binuclear cluster domain-containing protein n=1 Tax=Hirsutella rhossiliensis TaxID=111463 RepID=A0A9P8SEZ5_9HYPO|nr:fungal zn(2)-Cys(6) binuclear cluster domain-containing protein [Hirsutella rhossiliensis]KAH0958895.1 fungal zn(2)-Cys(6) binuclear cluster domain-containing protein [Hirsutella rhossiliensis]
MERRYPPLRPLAPAAESDSKSLSSGALEYKRRRVGVSVACNTCRRRKIRCDGQRPTCTNCRDQVSQCEYRDDAPLSDESKKLVFEMVKILNTLPAAELIRIMPSLGEETEASTILSILRGDPTSYQQSKASTTTGGTFENVELAAQCPFAYPVLKPLDPKTLQSERYRRPTEPAIGNAPTLPGPQPGNLTPTTESQEPKVSPQLCDPRLRELNIRLWTNVNIDNYMAAKCISLYLETDHPLLGHFDPELFVSHLISGQVEFCSSLLVNALLYWAFQMYSGIDPETEGQTTSLCAEAERLWNQERSSNRDSIQTMAAAEFLSLGYLGQGRDHKMLVYLSEATDMGIRLGLFGVKSQPSPDKDSELSAEAQGARGYAAWGVFNWITLMSLFYHQPELKCPQHPPQVPIPENQQHNADSVAEGPHTPASLGSQNVSLLPWYMGQTFPHLCRFWSIVHEFKFRELLAWGNGLPTQLTQRDQSPHHVQILHLWFHAAILDIFRPCIKESPKSRLRTFGHMGGSPEAVSAASVAQLERLIFDYRFKYQSSSYSILWHMALLYVANAILDGVMDENWYSCLLLCIYGYESLGRSWQVAEAITKALLSMMLRKKDVSSDAARRILHDLENKNWARIPGSIRATLIADPELAPFDPRSATVECLAAQFQENAMLRDYTNILDDDEIQ